MFNEGKQLLANIYQIRSPLSVGGGVMIEQDEEGFILGRVGNLHTHTLNAHF